MVKKFLTVLGLLSSLFYANAEKQFMIVELKSTSKISFLLEEDPVVTFENEQLVVNGNATTSYAISSVKNFHFSEFEETAAKEQLANMMSIFSIDEARLQVQNAKANEKITVVNMDGIAVASSSTDNEGSAVVTLPNQKGIYVLTVGTKSIKVIRK